MIRLVLERGSGGKRVFKRAVRALSDLLEDGCAVQIDVQAARSRGREASSAGDVDSKNWP
jgi:hypothetical protein